MVGLNRRTIYKYAERCSEFLEAMVEARKEAQDLLTAEARRRAVQGVLEPVFYKGRQCGEVVKYSDSLLALLIRAHNGVPHKVDSELNLQLDPELDAIKSRQLEQDTEDLDLTKLSDEELDTLEYLIRKCTNESMEIS